MTSGPSVFQELNVEIERVRADLRQLDQELTARNAELGALRSREARSLQELAKLRLEELAARRAHTELGDADRRALSLLDRRTTALADVDQALANAEATERELEAKRDRKRAAADAAAAALAAGVARCEARAASDPEAKRLAEELARVTAQAEQAEAKAAKAAADRDLKRQPYEADRLFSYLWKRRYRFPEYQGGPLARALDGWVAGLCRYDEAHRDYGMLLALPVHLRRHAETLKLRAEKTKEARLGLETALRTAEGIPSLEAEADAAESALAAVLEHLQAEEAREAALVHERAKLASGDDDFSREALLVLAESFGRAEVAALREAAARTRGESDDDVKRLKERQQSALAALERIETLRRRFRAQRYDAADSEFGSNFALGGLLGALVTGAQVLGDVWGEVQRYQRFRLPRHSPFGFPFPGRGPFGGNPFDPAPPPAPPPAPGHPSRDASTAPSPRRRDSDGAGGSWSDSGASSSWSVSGNSSSSRGDDRGTSQSGGDDRSGGGFHTGGGF